MKNWNIIHDISDPNPGNNSKSQVIPIPEFNIDSLPFLVFNGAQTFNLLNLKQGRMEELIKTSSNS